MSSPDEINNNPQLQTRKTRRVDNRRVENRLLQLESRIEKAREARDQYLEFMKTKYPEWQPPKITTYRSRSSGPPRQRPTYHNPVRPQFYDEDISHTTQHPYNYPRYYEENLSPPRPQPPPSIRPSLLGRLETSQYFWNNSTSQKTRPVMPLRANFLAVNEPIPSSQVVLDSDIPAMMSKLKEIKENLNNLREYRLSMPSIDYFKTIQPALKVPNFNEKPSPDNSTIYYGDPRKADLPTLAEIRSRLINMHFNIERRTREIIDEQNRIRSFSAHGYLSRNSNLYQNLYAQNVTSPYQNTPNLMTLFGNVGSDQIFPQDSWPPYPTAPVNNQSRVERLQKSIRNLQNQIFPQTINHEMTNSQFQNLHTSTETNQSLHNLTENSPGWMNASQNLTPAYGNTAQNLYEYPTIHEKPSDTQKIQQEVQNRVETQNIPVKTVKTPLQEEPKNLEVKIPDRRTINFGSTPTSKQDLRSEQMTLPQKSNLEPSPTISKPKEQEKSSYDKMLELLKPKTYVVSSSDSDEEKIPQNKQGAVLGSANLGGGSKNENPPTTMSTLKPSSSGLFGSSLSPQKASPKNDDSDSDFFG